MEERLFIWVRQLCVAIPTTGHGLRAKFHLHNWRRGHQSIYQKFSWILDSQLFQLMIQNLNNSTLCFRGPILSHTCMITRYFPVLIESPSRHFSKNYPHLEKKEKKIKYRNFLVHFRLSALIQNLFEIGSGLGVHCITFHFFL